MKVLKCHKFVLEVEMDKKAEIIPSKKYFYSIVWCIVTVISLIPFFKKMFCACFITIVVRHTNKNWKQLQKKFFCSNHFLINFHIPSSLDCDNQLWREINWKFSRFQITPLQFLIIMTICDDEFLLHCCNFFLHSTSINT